MSTQFLILQLRCLFNKQKTHSTQTQTKTVVGQFFTNFSNVKSVLLLAMSSKTTKQNDRPKSAHVLAHLLTKEFASIHSESSVFTLRIITRLKNGTQTERQSGARSVFFTRTKAKTVLGLFCLAKQKKGDRPAFVLAKLESKTTTQKDRPTGRPTDQNPPKRISRVLAHSPADERVRVHPFPIVR